MWPSYRPRRSWAFHPLSVLLLASFAAAVVLDKIEGLDVAITRIGDCTHKAQEGDKIWMHYRGTLQSNGIEFDSSYAGGHPFAFHLGQEEVIKGWDLGLEDICLGEARKLIIPAELAYGDAGSPPKIPGGAILVFTTECVGINTFLEPNAFRPGTKTITPTLWPEDPPLSTTTSESIGIVTAPPEPTAISELPDVADAEGATAHAILPPDLPVTAIPPPSPTATPIPASSDGAETDQDTGECKLLGPFALLIQAALGGLALLSLVYKRWRESPRRPVKIWFFDVSKQVVGSVLLHILNLLMSMLSSGQFDVAVAVKPGSSSARRDEGFVQGDTASREKPNPCSFYLLNLAIDTTIGIPILVLLLRILHGLFRFTPLANPPESIRSGNYGSPPRTNWWLKQSLIYFIGLFGMKLCVWLFFQLLPWIAWIGDWALRWTEGNEALQIAFVMLFFPLIMNALQYWIIDSFIKDPAGGESGAWDGHERIPQSDDADDDDSHGRRDLHEAETRLSDEVADQDFKGSREALKEVNPTPLPAYDDHEQRGGSSGSNTGHRRGASAEENKK